jgi:NADH-quinone oxidoreductase subunit L
MFFKAFSGGQRVPEGVHAHESGRWMLVPLVILAIGAVLAGYFSVPGDRIGHFLEPSTHEFAVAAAAAHHVGGHAEVAHGFWAQYGLMVLSGALVVTAIGLAYLLYVRLPWLPGLVAEIIPSVRQVLFNKYYVDEGYDATVVRPLRQSGRFCFGLDEYVVDGLIFLVTAVPRLMGYIMRGFQTGSMQGYGLTMAVGMGIIIVLVLLV